MSLQFYLAKLPHQPRPVCYSALVVQQTSLQKTTNNPFSKYLECLVCISLQCFAILIAGHELWNGLAHVILHRMLSNELVSAATVLLHSFRSAHCSQTWRLSALRAEMSQYVHKLKYMESPNIQYYFCTIYSKQISLSFAIISNTLTMK